ncbi:septum site-determining protein MinC [Caldisericum exile]|uniref:Septum site-determining protein MinC n=1 Tax=Caldisericum exile (strain DSM 21853 / NBRC 104410 / AZM16c01) TaxID=511051 RepID=A0A7U6GEY3_CALEA|nr:septum site-determining protein MinC [Caldisericum exile]BAL81072.1 septum site-determining protein MinC [Caldisericum exile AZM16c01]
MKDIVTLKGINGDVVLKIDPVAPFEDVLDRIRNLIESERNFFSKGFLSIDTQGRELSELEISKLESLFNGINVSFRINEGEKVFGGTFEQSQPSFFVVDHTVRSGQVVRYKGDIVILGNVNPDGVVESESDVYVYGVIKGKVTAGKRVVALGFQQQYLNINGIEVEAKTPEKSRKPYIIEIDTDKKVTIVPLDEREAKPVRRRKNG